MCEKKHEEHDGIVGGSVFNKNCYRYLREIARVLNNQPQDWQKQDAFNEARGTFLGYLHDIKSESGGDLVEFLDNLDNKYDPNYPYGDLYTAFIERMDKADPFSDQVFIDKDSLYAYYLSKFIDAIYRNPNKNLEKTFEEFKDIVDGTDPHQNLESDIAQVMRADDAEDIAENETNPTDQGSRTKRFLNTFWEDNYKPQSTTNAPQVRKYKYKEGRDYL